MFGLVSANVRELTKEEKCRYNAIYCGICRGIRGECSQTARLGLSYDMAFLALLLTSLYEPEETAGKRACALHPIRPKPWVDNKYIRYCAAMNVALAYYKALDDAQDEGGAKARLQLSIFGREMARIREEYPRQCDAMAENLARLRQLEKENCDNPDLPAGCFGALLGEVFVYEEDLWAKYLRSIGKDLGRYIYLADAAMDFRRDRKKGQYNPFLAMGVEDPAQWEQYLLLAMGRCTDCYERLPLVQDKAILDNILYSGVWVAYRNKLRSNKNDSRSL